jgi:tyrosyl-tRNA synthetase
MDKIEEILTRGVETICPTKAALEKVLRSGKKIRLYQGFDPSMPNLHLGHLVGILKLRQFQELGHEVIFLVGDFTGMIGDPTDKTAVRKRLSRQQVLENCRSWKKQAGKILKFTGQNPAKFLFNSHWLAKISFKDLIGISAHFTVQQMLDRDFFQRRLKTDRPIFLHEFLYPVAQAYDSVAMGVDLEVGGNDQIFNMLCGRTLIKALKNKEKFVLTTKLLVDSQGNKVGKTAGNALFLNVSPTEMYGAIMSFPDEVVPLAFELLTSVPLNLIPKMKKTHPMKAKMQLAWEIVNNLYSAPKANLAQKEFSRVFQKRETPRDLAIFKAKKATYSIIDLLIETKLASSRGEAKRLVAQKAVDLNSKAVTDSKKSIVIKNGLILQVGKKRFIKIFK